MLATTIGLSDIETYATTPRTDRFHTFPFSRFVMIEVEKVFLDVFQIGSW
jgi:hypothetical protein